MRDASAAKLPTPIFLAWAAVRAAPLYSAVKTLNVFDFGFKRFI
jgi:hypothetical protein